VPHSKFLTAEEARRLTCLEGKLDKLKIACRIVELHEDLNQINAGLLKKIRQRKESGKTLYPIGEAAETARWCSSCQRYADPVRYRVIPDVLVGNACDYCDANLPTLSELSNRLQSRSSQKQKEAAHALAKTYRYNTSELSFDNIERLIKALSAPVADVRKNTATALMHIGKRLSSVKKRGGGSADLKDLVLGALIQQLRVEKETSARGAIIAAIGRIGQGSYQAGRVKKPLKDALKDDNLEIVKTAATAAAEIGDEHLLFSVRAVCERPEFYNKDYAPDVLEALGRFGRLRPDSLKLFSNLLADDDKDVRVRQKAASFLGNFGGESEVLELLKKIAHDPRTDPNLQLDVKQALASISLKHNEASSSLAM
jgi:hypothetical protein